MPVINELCEKYQLSRFNLEVEDEKTYKYKYDYSKRVKQTGTYTNDMILRDVDECISKADSYEKFKILMQEKGHLINDDPKHKYITIGKSYTRQTDLYESKSYEDDCRHFSTR